MTKLGKKFASPLGSSERVLSDGSVATPGEPVMLDADAQKDEHNKRLIDEGQLVEVRDKEQEVRSETRS